MNWKQAFSLGLLAPGEWDRQNAEPVAYLYGEEKVRLPGLPEWDTVTYPYAFIMPYSDYPEGYWLQVASSGVYFNGSSCRFYNKTVYYQNYQILDGVWSYKNEGSISAYNGALYTVPIWANHDVTFNNGTVYLATSDPIPVYE